MNSLSKMALGVIGQPWSAPSTSDGSPALAHAMGPGTDQQMLLAQTVGWPADAVRP